MPVVDATSAEAAASSAVAAPAAARRGALTSRISRDAISGLMDSMAVENPDSTVQGLKDKAAELRKRKKELARQLRNATRKNKRIKEKAKQLSTADLLAVICMRQAKAGDEGEAGNSSTAMHVCAFDDSSGHCGNGGATTPAADVAARPAPSPSDEAATGTSAAGDEA